MRKSEFDYSAFEQLDKDQRRKAVLDSGKLNDKRFVLPPNPEILGQLHSLRETVDELKEYYPEIISFGLFGSLTKGYATKKSDLDGVLYLDLRQSLDNYRDDGRSANIPDNLRLTSPPPHWILARITLKPQAKQWTK